MRRICWGGLQRLSPEYGARQQIITLIAHALGWKCMHNGAESRQIVEIVLVVVIIGVALGGAYWQYRVLSRVAKVADERRTSGESEPNTIGKRIFILICAAALIGISVWLMQP